MYLPMEAKTIPVKVARLERNWEVNKDQRIVLPRLATSSSLTFHLEMTIRSEDLELYRMTGVKGGHPKICKIRTYSMVDRSAILLEFVLDTPRLANSGREESVS